MKHFLRVTTEKILITSKQGSFHSTEVILEKFMFLFFLEETVV